MIFDAWIRLQKYAHRDQLINRIVTAIVNNQDFDWNDANLVLHEEAWIQHLLRQQGWSLRCFELNKLPTTVKDFQTYLYREDI